MRKLQRSSETRQIVLQGVAQLYCLKRSTARASLALTVNAQGLLVHAPWSLALRHIECFMVDKAVWIQEKLTNHNLRLAAEQNWQDGMVLLFLGEEVILRVSANIHAVTVADNVLYVPQLFRNDLKKIVQTWYQDFALVHFKTRLQQFAPLLPRQPRDLKLTGARTRWGSCTADGVVRLNWRLLQASNAEIDYVLAHELAHLTHMNHSAKFWQELGRIYADYKVPHKLLRVHGHRYHQVS